MKTGEDKLVERIAEALAARRRPRRAGRRELALGVDDDAALMVPRPGYESILTCDWFLEGSHFFRDTHPPESVGWKCLARAVSDVAAMGGRPVCFLLSLALPQTHTNRWLDRFLAGLSRAQRKLDCELAGGDTTRSNQILINVTVVGEVRRGRTVLRSGGKPGDLIYVSGRLGEAELGLRWLRASRTASRRNSTYVKKHLYPEPRVVLGEWLAERRIASAMMDLSDGLSTDLPRLCAASRVGARIEAEKLPALQVPSRRSRSRLDLTDLALNGGDDYELLFTVRPSKVRRIPSSFKGIPLTRIGQIVSGRKLNLVWPGGRQESLLARGWDPFRPDR